MMPTKIGRLKITIKIAAMGIRNLVNNTLSLGMPIRIKMDLSTRYGVAHLMLQLGFNKISVSLTAKLDS
jgi:hypothetical protein